MSSLRTTRSQLIAMRSFHEQRDFKTLLLEDPDLLKVLSPAEIEKAFDLQDQMRNVDAIFARVLGSPRALRSGTGGIGTGTSATIPVASASSGKESQ